jgi:hypothetical protein
MRIKIDSANVKPNTSEKDKADPEKAHMPWTAEECTKVMVQTSDYIKLVSNLVFSYQHSPPS